MSQQTISGFRIKNDVARGYAVRVRHTYGHWRQLKEQADLVAGEEVH